MLKKIVLAALHVNSPDDIELSLSSLPQLLLRKLLTSALDRLSLLKGGSRLGL